MVIFINGSINSGKTTVADILVKKIPNTAHVDIDMLRFFITWMPLDESIPINLENAALVIKNFVEKGLNVVVTYPISQKNYEFLMEKLKDLKDKIYFFTLNPQMQTILNRGVMSDAERERVRYHYKIEINKPMFGVIIDSTGKTPEQTAQEMLKLLRK